MMSAFKFIVTGAAEMRIRRLRPAKPAFFGNNPVTHLLEMALEPK